MIKAEEPTVPPHASFSNQNFAKLSLRGQLKCIPEGSVCGLAVVSVWAGLPARSCFGALLAHLQRYLFFIIWVISNVFSFPFRCFSSLTTAVKEYAAHPGDNRMPHVFNEKDNYVVLIIIVIFYLPVTSYNLSDQCLQIINEDLIFEPKACPLN